MIGLSVRCSSEIPGCVRRSLSNESGTSAQEAMSNPSASVRRGSGDIPSAATRTPQGPRSDTRSAAPTAAADREASNRDVDTGRDGRRDRRTDAGPREDQSGPATGASTLTFLAPTGVGNHPRAMGVGRNYGPTTDHDGRTQRTSTINHGHQR